MKKTVAFLLAAVMLWSLVSVFAEEEAKEITWQDIPWGCTRADVMKNMIENQWIQSEEDTDYSAYGSDEWAWASFVTAAGCICEWTDYELVNSLRGKGINILATKRGVKPELTIAGYPVKEKAFTFAPDGSFMTVGISLDKAKADDLIGKLESVYGESELTADRDDFYNLYFKQGENSTAVALVESNFWGDGPYLVYGKTVWEEILNMQLGEPAAEPSPAADGFDTSGL